MITQCDAGPQTRQLIPGAPWQATIESLHEACLDATPWRYVTAQIPACLYHVRATMVAASRQQPDWPLVLQPLLLIVWVWRLGSSWTASNEEESASEYLSHSAVIATRQWFGRANDSPSSSAHRQDLHDAELSLNDYGGSLDLSMIWDVITRRIAFSKLQQLSCIICTEITSNMDWESRVKLRKSELRKLKLNEQLETRTWNCIAKAQAYKNLSFRDESSSWMSEPGLRKPRLTKPNDSSWTSKTW